MNIHCAVKKRPGQLLLENDVLKFVSAGEPVLLPLADVQGMQATPPTAAKLRIKLGAKEGPPLMLEFSNADSLDTARSELQAAIKQFREPSEHAGSNVPSQASHGPASSATNTAPGPAPGPASGSSSGSSSGPKPRKKKVSLDPAKLVQNLDLQRQVLREDPELMRTFDQVVVRSTALTNEQFWQPRMHLLVTAAQQQAQTPGSYNVLSTIKPTTTSDNRVNINLTREKISDLFDQYPLVRRAYNENVPKLNESEFWQRFFMSRFFLVLRGEKVSASHTADAVFDPYIDILHDLQARQRQRQAEEDHSVPLFVNVSANAEDNPETYGNDIVTTAGGGTRSLIRSMNGLSQRLLRGKKRGREDEEELPTMQEELQLRDLQTQQSTEKDVGLHIDVDTVTQHTQISAEDQARQNRALLEKTPEQLTLHCEYSDAAAVFVASLTPHPEMVAVQGESVSADVQMVYATTMEFLKQYWYARNHNSEEEPKLRTYLVNSLARIDAVGGVPALQAVADSVKTALNE